MTCDIVIRGGTVFDGGGRIAAIADSFARYTAAKPPALVYVCYSSLKHQGVHL